MGFAYSYSSNSSLAGIPVVINSSTLSNNQTIIYNNGQWVNANVLSQVTTDGSINVTLSSGILSMSLNTANSNTWTAKQIFNAGIDGKGSTGNLTAGAGILGTANKWSALQTFSSGITGSGTTGNLTAGSGILNTSNTWGALQIFGNNISFGGGTLNISNIANNQTILYNANKGIWVNSYVINNITTDSSLNVSINSGNASLSLNTNKSNFWNNLQIFNGGALVNIPAAISSLYNNSPKKTVSQSLLNGVI